MPQQGDMDALAQCHGYGDYGDFMVATCMMGARRRRSPHEQAQFDAELEAERVQREADRKVLAEVRAQELAQAKITARETLDQLWAERLARTEALLADRREQIAQVSKWAFNAAVERAKRECPGLYATHVAYLHVVKGATWASATATVRDSPTAWDDPVPMSDEEHEARRLLGQPGRRR